MAREAQPSLLDEENYQLPQLGLLAEPKRPSVPTISAEALEQNAALLEGTLEDFGVPRRHHQGPSRPGRHALRASSLRLGRSRRG